ncbi:hypothetical protein [uncultured Pelagimonas sp.]|uniref:DUF7146 domain-containing protein n=1 Tax=uncultured Pelagimonas sp. TaxID=1618102 RepID=UPI002629FE36|nr:hypothetical protein [uncultured Pelagimonas sp.]
MSFPDDPRIDEAKAKDVIGLVDRLAIQGLVRVSHELIGPCPLCGGSDRFGINLTTKAFNCRRCDLKGGDTIALVMGVLNKAFPQALDWICGELPPDLDPKEAERRRAKAKRDRERQDSFAEKQRKRAVDMARSIWQEGVAPEGTAVETYLNLRGLTGVLPRLSKCLRYHPNLPYMVKEGRQWVELHRGPAMLAAVQSQQERAMCVHRTWLDLNEPGGKMVLRGKDGNPIVDDKGNRLKVKKTLGSKQGGAIRLRTPNGTDTLIMGEGIETTLTALVAQPVGMESAAYWAGVDLGNMAGPMQKLQGVKHSGLPIEDPAKPCFVPPPWVKRLVFIMDGDSEPNMTRAKLECGIRRAQLVNPELEGLIVPTKPGADLNDMLVGKPSKTEEGV